MSPIAARAPRLAVPARRPARGGVRAGRRHVGLHRPHRVLGGGRPRRREQAVPLGHRQGARGAADRVAADGASLRRREGGARLAVEHPPAGRLAGRRRRTSSPARCSTARGAPRRCARLRRTVAEAGVEPLMSLAASSASTGRPATPTPSPGPIWPRSSTTSAVRRPPPRGTRVIIDCHGHYTTAPAAHTDWRDAQLAGVPGRAARRPATRRSPTTRSARRSRRTSCGCSASAAPT